MKEVFNKRYLALSILGHLIFISQLIVFGPWYLLTIILGIVAFNLGYSLYMHRTLAHKHYDFTVIQHTLFSLIACSLNFGSPAVLASVHYNHHKYSGTKNDPHDPNRLGIFRTLFKLWDKKYIPNKRPFKEFLADPLHHWFHLHHYTIASVATILFPFINVTAFWLSTLVILPVHSRRIGYQNFNIDDSTNVPLLKPLLWGEELHNNHHKHPGMLNHNVAHSVAEFDPLYHIGSTISCESFR